MKIKSLIAAACLAAAPVSSALADTVHTATTTERIQLEQFLDTNGNGVLLMPLDVFYDLNPEFRGLAMSGYIPKDTDLRFVVQPTRA